MIAAADYAELLEDEDLSPLQRSMFESELRRATNREKLQARISEGAREATTVHNWLQETMRAARDLLVMQLEVEAWEQRKHRPYCYDGTYARLRRKRDGFMERLANLRRQASEGGARQQQWMADHAELIATLEAGV
jgi:CRISPR/Cas system-associated endoribonuclease Cas2